MSIFEHDSDLGLCLSPAVALLEAWWAAAAWGGRMEEEWRLRVEVVCKISHIKFDFRKR